jgi:acetyltransferase-like isoleucine patch superfamily enzyme
MKKALIIGGNGHGSVIDSCLNDNHKHGKDLDIEICGYVNDFVDHVDEYPVLGGTNDIARLVSEDFYFFWGIHLIERNSLTYNTFLRMVIPEDRLLTLVHHSAYIGKNVQIGVGCLVMYNAYIAQRSVIGKCSMIKANTCIGHDVSCEPLCHFAMGSTVGSFAQIGLCSDVAINAVVLEKKHIGNFAMAAAGSLITHDIPDHEIHAGVPAKFLKRTSDK